MSDIKEAVINTSERITASHAGGSDMKWRLILSDFSINDSDELELLIVSSGRYQALVCPVCAIERTPDGRILIEADISPLKSRIETCRAERWKAYLTVRESDTEGKKKTYILSAPGSDNTETEKPKKKQKDIFKRRFDLVKEPVGEFPFMGSTVEAVPDCVSGGEWMLCVADRCQRYMYAVRCIGIGQKIAKRSIMLSITCPLIDGIEWKGIVLAFRYRLEEDREEYFFPINSTSRGKDSIEATVTADLEGLEFKPIYWDVRMVFEKDGNEFWCHVMSPESDEASDKADPDKSGLGKIFAKQSIDIEDGLQLSIGCTDKGNTTVIAQQHTQYSGLMFRLKERIAILLYKLMGKSLRRKKIFLVFEKYCSMAQENGYYFFKFCMENDMESVMGRSIYYVIDKSQSDYNKLKPYKDHVLQFMSLKHMLYVLAARLLISSDSKRHAYAWRASESVIRKRVLKDKKSVFLQHGVFGLKRSDEFKRGTGGGTNLFIASNEMEKGFIIYDMGYVPDQIAVTGLARWDVLEDKSSGITQKHILVMPTWRKWLEESTDEAFLESEYYLKYMELINSDRLSGYLENRDFLMDFYIHPKFSEQIKQFTAVSDRIRIIPFGSEPLNKLLMECSLLITDYSSVCWDVYYQGKPVIFYQFDLEKYNETTGSYMDLEKDLFGDRAKTEDELFDLLDEAEKSGFALKPQYADMREGMFAYIDHHNSRRICEEIMNRGW